MSFSENFLQCVGANGLISSGDTLVVAVSGGADSMALLLALFQFRRDLGLKLIVAHYDHNLRSSSKKDCVFVAKAARRLGLVFVREVNDRVIPLKGSIEEFARERRYDFLFRTAVKYRADAVVTAHTRDDLAETVLMRVLRGTGLAGLKSILPKRTMKGIVLIRPMLTVSRDEVEAFLKEAGVEFITDPTNASLDFTRNKIRRQLIPYLEKEFQPGVKDNLARLADTAANDYDFIEMQAAIILKKYLKRSSGRVSLELFSFRPLHVSLRRAVLRSMYACLDKKPNSLTLTHIEQIEKGVFDAKAVNQDGRISLPGGVVFFRTGNKLVFKGLLIGKSCP